MKKTIIINLYGSPGTGKSTIAAQLFSLMKWNKIRCELVTEYAKDLVWEERSQTIKNQIYIFGKQYKRLFNLIGKVDYIITDSPILLGAFYAKKQPIDNPFFEDMIIYEHNKMNTIDIFLNRIKEYDKVGRIHTEDESNQYSEEIKKSLNDQLVDFDIFDATEFTAMQIFNKYIKIIKNMSEKPKITFKNVSAFIEGNIKHFGSKFNLMPKYYKEQITYRVSKCRDCAERGSCTYCGCSLPGKWYVNESCNNGKRFPDIMSEEKWEKFKKDNNLSFD